MRGDGTPFDWPQQPSQPFVAMPPRVVGLPRPETEAYVTRRQLAEMMAVSVDTVKRLDRAGMPRAVFGSRTVRYRPSVAIAWAREYNGERKGLT